MRYGLSCRSCPVPRVLQEFELTINLDRLLAEADRDQNGWLSYDEFKSILA